MDADLEQTFNLRFLNLDIEASCEEYPDIQEIQPVRETEPWMNRFKQDIPHVIMQSLPPGHSSHEIGKNRRREFIYARQV